MKYDTIDDVISVYTPASLGGMSHEVTEVAMTEIATTFKILQTGNSYIRK